jgi:NAD(P)-dependent dehydrogenase (short-subunit alcohol dehydrogenase family)
MRADERRVDGMASKHWTAADIPDMTGRTVIVTGASSGLGLATTRDFAHAGARVVLAVRNIAKGEEVARAIGGQTEVRTLELTNLSSIRAFARAWTGPVDVLVNNAGIMMVPEGKTADGFELQIGTNHLGHFALTTLLLPHITDRVVTVTSHLHRNGHIDVDDLNWERRRYNPDSAYADSKQANLLFTLELQRRLGASGSRVRAVSAHPGIASTNLGTHLGGFRGLVAQVAVRVVAQDAEHGALPTLYAATQDVPGNAYVGPDGIGHIRGFPVLQAPSKASQDPELAAHLWERSAALTGVDTTVPAAA